MNFESNSGAPRRGPGRPPKQPTQVSNQASISTPVSIRGAVEAPVPSPLPVSEPTLAESPAPQAARPVRRPFGSFSQKLARPERKGYKRRWFNDTPGRILRAKEAGWEHVLTESRVPETAPVGVSETGGALMAFLMEIPEEFYAEDMAAEQARIDEMERSFKRGADNQGQPEVDGRYIPSRGINIRTV